MTGVAKLVDRRGDDSRRVMRGSPQARSAHVQLRESTADVHRAVEASLDLLNPLTDRARLAAVVSALGIFWNAALVPVEEWAAGNRREATRLQWSRRRGNGRASRDCVRLGHDGVTAGIDPGPYVPPCVPVTANEVFGWLYVHEGSTLGGAVLHRALDRVLEGRVLETFMPYEEGPAPMWRRYLRLLDQGLITGELDIASITIAATRAFDGLAAFLQPLGNFAHG